MIKLIKNMIKEFLKCLDKINFKKDKAITLVLFIRVIKADKRNERLCVHHRFASVLNTMNFEVTI